MTNEAFTREEHDRLLRIRDRHAAHVRRTAQIADVLGDHLSFHASFMILHGFMAFLSVGAMLHHLAAAAQLAAGRRR